METKSFWHNIKLDWQRYLLRKRSNVDIEVQAVFEDREKHGKRMMYKTGYKYTITKWDASRMHEKNVYSPFYYSTYEDALYNAIDKARSLYSDY